MGFPERVMQRCAWALDRKRVMLLASPFPLTSVPALRSHLCVALSSDTVKSILMIPRIPLNFKLLLSGNYGPDCPGITTLLAAECGHLHLALAFATPERTRALMRESSS